MHICFHIDILNLVCLCVFGCLTYSLKHSVKLHIHVNEQNSTVLVFYLFIVLRVGVLRLYVFLFPCRSSGVLRCCNLVQMRCTWRRKRLKAPVEQQKRGLWRGEGCGSASVQDGYLYTMFDYNKFYGFDYLCSIWVSGGILLACHFKGGV